MRGTSPPMSPHSGRLLSPRSRGELEKAEKEAGRSVVSRNIYVTLVLCVIWGFADSIWSGTVLVNYAYQLCGGDDNKQVANLRVGYLEAAQGLTGLITALPVGVLADRYGRQPVVRCGGVGFMIATGVTVYAVLLQGSEDTTYYCLMAAMCVWGFAGGIFNGPVQALFADSIPVGDRSYWYSLLMLAYLLPSVAGPLLSIGLFQWFGNTWSLSELRPVIMFGVFAEVPAAIISFYLRDDLAVKEPGEEEEEEEEEEGEGEEKIGQVQEGGSGESGSGAKRACWGCYCLDQRAIPYIIFIGDLLTALGSGMTVKFFPLYFRTTLGLSPSEVQGIYACTPVLMAGITVLVQRISKTAGRVQMVILSRVIGIGLLVTMGLLADMEVNKWFIIAPIYIIRTALMNSTYPLEESVLMDFTPKNQRAKWKTLESVSAFGWCGSAMLGGYLVGTHKNYAFTFYITAAMQCGGQLLWMLLLPLVPRKEKEDPKSKQKQKPKNAKSGLSHLASPLLGSEHSANASDAILAMPGDEKI